MRDLASNISPVVVFGPVTINADNTPAAIDLQGFDSATLLLGIGIGGVTFNSTDKIEFVLTHSDDNVTYNNVSVTDLVGKDAPVSVTGGIIKSLTAAHAAAAQYEFGYVGGKRYLKLLADFSGTHNTGTPLSAVIIKGHANNAPTS